MHALDILVESGDLASYEYYRGMGGDDLLYLVLPSGRELHITASIEEGRAAILRVRTPSLRAQPPGRFARFFARTFGSW